MGRALVTGASNGLGLEIARLLDESGVEVVLVARSASVLEGIASSMNHAIVLPADLSTADGVRTVLDQAGTIDILVNNAGFGECGDFASIDPAVSTDMIQVNCSALTALTAAFLPAMIERGSGNVLNIASTAAFQPGPTMAVYYATKAYVLSFTEAIAEETRKTGVKVTAVCPGAFASGFQDVAHAGNTRLIKGRKLPTSKDMAEAALVAMKRGDVVSVPGIVNKIGATSPRFSPRPLVRRVAHFIQREV